MQIPSRVAPLLTLVIITPLLAELGSGNVSPLLFLRPVTWIFVGLTYGIPILVIRECAVRWRLGLVGLLLLGLAYGVYNEGVLAHTLLMHDHLPVPPFNHSAVWFGISVSWALFICGWHTLYSVLYPLLLIRGLFPRHANTPWIGAIATIVLAGASLVLVPAVVRPLPPSYSVAFILTISLLTALAFLARGVIPRWRREVWQSARWGAFLFGLCAYAPFLLLIALATLHVPFVLFIGVCVISTLCYLGYGYGAGLFTFPSLLRIAVGGYLAVFLFAAVSGIARHAPDRVFAVLALAALLLALLRYMDVRDARAVAG